MSLPPSYNLLEQYKNKYFVETGSYRGDAIQLALDAGFNEVRSCDINQENIFFCEHRFDIYHNQDDGIVLYHGDSAHILGDMISDINEPITFWLDSHWQLFEDEPLGDNPFPLLKELAQIAEHPIKTHTILIDDILYMTHPNITGWDLEMIKSAIKKINKNYKFKLIANPVINNLLIAYI